MSIAKTIRITKTRIYKSELRITKNIYKSLEILKSIKGKEGGLKGRRDGAMHSITSPSLVPQKRRVSFQSTTCASYHVRDAQSH